MKETGGQLAAGTLGEEPRVSQVRPKETPAERRKQKRKAAEAAATAKATQAAEATNAT